ncbi:hypothetical protein ACIBG8_05640 [Nonomuraea sp. NPDC050556]|uniref:hypothetical protein n=1 Tax=Nonomuraea sp. NPDC050556 TaxID=3364369 RepID=UPI0037A62EF0
MSNVRRLAAVTTTALALALAGAGTASASGYTYVRSYFPANSTTLAQCNADGQEYADGSTGYYCQYYPSSWQTHTPHYELYVGP